MIDFKYVLTVDMKTSAPEYRPDPNMPTHLRNIFKISGPNSSGKSTFMNIVALATHGLKTPSITKSIKARIEDLIESDYKTLEFDLRMEDPVSKTVLRAEKKKDTRDITLYESVNGEREKILAPDTFLQRYKLIYDIPENPTGRIKELASELKDWQKGYLDYFYTFQTYVSNTHKDVESSRDERALREKNSELNDARKDLDVFLSNDKPAEIELLTKLILAKKLFKANKDKNDAERDFDKMKPYLKQVSKQDADNTVKTIFSSSFRDMKEFVDTIITPSLIVKDQGLDEILNTLEPVTSFNQISQKDDFNAYISNLEGLIRYAFSLKRPEIDNEARMVNELLIVLNQYRTEVKYLSGIGPLNDLIESLDKIISSKGDNSAKIRAINAIKTNAQKIHDSLTAFKDAFSKMQSPKNDEDDRKYKNALEFQSKFNNAKNKLERLLPECGQCGINLDNMAQMMEFFNHELGSKYSSSKIEELENNLSKLSEGTPNKEEIKKLNDFITRTQAEIKSMESAKTHEYKGKELIILRISNEVQKLRGNYQLAQEKIDAVLNNKNASFDSKRYDPHDPFFESVWAYLGSRLGYVQHLDKSYEVEKVNLIEDTIITRDGTIIHMKDMGTGQGQLTYLMGLLSTDEEKKIIAMFDEVAAMSSSTLNKIFERFEELQNDGRLMLGMTVLPGDEYKVIQYGLGD